MQIIEPSATLVAATENAEQIIADAARICYDRPAAERPGALIHFLLTQDPPHESPLEHASATLDLVCDRGIANELTRHRIASFSQRSTRYCREQNGIRVIRPLALAPDGLTVRQAELNWAWHRAMLDAEAAYERLLELGATPQEARAVLPTCLATKVRMTANLREWRHILRLREDKAAHPQMRELMALVRPILEGIAPNVFGKEVGQ